MRTKSYFANSIKAAMAQAREELGADAALVTSRPSPPEVRHLGEYEVVFATDAPETPPISPPQPAIAGPVLPTPAAVRAPYPRPPVETEGALATVVSELRALRQQVLRQTAMRALDDPRWISSQPEVPETYAALLAAEVDPELALGLVLAAQERGRGSAYSFFSALRDEVIRMVPVDSRFSDDGGAVALIGPPGAGKTAMLTRIAVRRGILERRPVHFISLDTLRVAAGEQLRTYATILGATFETVPSTRALDQALRDHRRRALVFIDTPGLTARDLEAGGDDTAPFFARRDDIQKHLVLPASMRAADLARCAAAYAAFRPSRLIFTHMDQTETFGALLNETVGTGLPVSFFGTGQKVPEDIEDASAAALAARILPRELAAPGARSAA